MTTTQTKHPVEIPAKLLIAVAKWAYQHDDRPHLATVMFGAGEMVAVDGHRLVRVPLTHRDGTPYNVIPRFGITASDLTAAAIALNELGRGDHRRVTISITPNDNESPGIAVFRDVTRRLGFAIMVKTRNDADFPNIEKVMPKSTGAASPDGYCFNPEYLSAIDEVQTAAGASDGDRICRISGWSADGL